jgi:hypothetical protein
VSGSILIYQILQDPPRISIGPMFGTVALTSCFGRVVSLQFYLPLDWQPECCCNLRVVPENSDAAWFIVSGIRNEVLKRTLISSPRLMLWSYASCRRGIFANSDNRGAQFYDSFFRSVRFADPRLDGRENGRSQTYSGCLCTL